MEERDPSDLWKDALEKARPPRKLRAAFTTIQVSTEADELIESHRQAAFATGSWEGDENYARVQTAYSHLNVTAESLYKYIERLERYALIAGSYPTVTKRF